MHIHSFSASTIRQPDNFWVGPLIRHGAAGTLGNVYEPFLQLTPTLDIFYDRLVNGLTFAESAYAALPAVSWITTLVGDPFILPVQPRSNIRELFLAGYPGTVRAREHQSTGIGAGIKQTWSRQSDSAAGLIEAQEGKKDAALATFNRAARASYKKRSEKFRCALHQRICCNP